MRVDWLVIDGHRVAEDDVRRVSEYRCDNCGEFLPSDDVVILQSLQVIRYGRVGAFDSLPQIHLHEACFEKQMPFAARKVG